MKVISKKEENFVWINFQNFNVSNFYNNSINIEGKNIDEKSRHFEIVKFFKKIASKLNINIKNINYSFENNFINFELDNNSDITKFISVLIKKDNNFAFSNITVNIGKVVSREIGFDING
ncbi:hypothetical protein ACM0K4_02830 [Mycoplasma sp. VS42A]|uniref:hypothetical protein n=1 Tax=unclassified Mycoplasma TaxID=2683645 RepID=UPI003A887B80